MANFKEIEEKWQKKWKENKTFEPIVDNQKEKFFLTFPYPYINAYPHIGHLYTLMRVEAFARYKKLQGFNVLFPQGWHATGSPIVNAAKRVKEREPKQMKIMQDMKIAESDIPKFEKPEYWIEFFAPEFRRDYQNMGLAIDWRREFHTTSLNPHYDKFIRWQFKKLKEKEYVIKKRFPVVWCPKDNMPIGDHDRIEGEGNTTKDFIWGKFRMKNSDLLIMAGTTRPDAFYGQTNLWIDPKGDYVIIKVKNEKWVIGRKNIDKIKKQFEENISIIKAIEPKELIGKIYKGPVVDYEITALPAWFIDAAIGSGIVYSALEDPVDLFELKKIQENEEIQEQYKLNKEIVKKLKPIYIINVPGMGENLGEEIGKEFGIKSAKDIELLEKAKGELNKRVFRKGTMRESCKECSGMTVPECQDYLKKSLVEHGDAVMFYELEGKVVCRCLTEAVVKMVEDQWFVDYNNPKWKSITHKCFNQIKLYPEKTRQQFDYVIDWLHEWACTREEGLGTKLPWDEKWLIESLSDSTIYMAYYTIAHLIKKIPLEYINDELFDYVFLNKGRKNELFKETIEQMKNEFEYWYPVDFRNSGKDLIQNHLTFYIFNHTAIFPEKYWPRGIGTNGWVTVDGQKMSKSLGNVIPIRDIIKEFGVDSSRITILNGGEGMDDPNWDTSFAKTVNNKLENLEKFILENYNKGRKNEIAIDNWFKSKSNRIIKEATELMEETMFRSAIQKIYFEFEKTLRAYITKAEPNKDLTTKAINNFLVMLSPFTPHFCEEVWHKLGHKDFIVNTKWPKSEDKFIDAEAEFTEEIISDIISDINQVKKLTNIELPNEIELIIASKWKYEFLKNFKEKIKDTRNVGELIQECRIKGYEKEISKIIPNLLKNQSKVPKQVLSQEKDLEIIEENKEYLQKQATTKIKIILAEQSKEVKANNAMPGKPAIIIK